ncbi:Uncharacterized protein Adt_18993 [Abeliophyllum distichum]|uniref:Uncharacterized protein n=1 Tax=Abeliophyllum distichum TaxID=126358 RepID=A0ABD1TLF7_9LAMI
MLVNDAITVNILFGSTFDQIDVDHELMAISELLFGFTRDSLIPQGRITFAVDFGESLHHLRKFIEFLVVDTRFTYHGVLGRPVLKDLQTVTSIHPPLGNEVFDTRKAKRREGTPVVMTIHLEPMDVELKKMNEEMILDKGLDLRIIGSNSLATPSKELEAFSVNPSDPT